MRSERVLSVFWVKGLPAVAIRTPAPGVGSAVLRPSDGTLWRVAAVEQGGTWGLTSLVLVGPAVPAEGDELESLG